VIGLGCLSVDDLLYVPAYPPADAKTRVTRGQRQCGGLTGTALVAAARLGARCAFAGCLGTDALSDFAAQNFANEGVDTAHAPRLAEARIVRAVIIVSEDTGGRNIFYEIDGLIGAHPTLPSEELIRAARVLFIDQYGMEGNLRAVAIAREAGIPIVADFEADDPRSIEMVMDKVDHLILSESFASRATGIADPVGAARALWRPDRAAVIVTCGAEGCWSVSAPDPTAPRHHPAFRVEVRDTTGCGDVFHGAYAAALAQGECIDRRLRFASAAAALKATQPGGQQGIPTRKAVDDFLAEIGV
jgi:sugar/nucleoside kinase (ribokinase family)